MGSILQATPMLLAIREKYPEAKIIFVSTKSNLAILQKIKVIDQIVVVDDSGFLKFVGSNISALFTLIRIRPQIYFDLEIYSDYSTLFTLFTLSVNRVGFYLRSSSFRMGIYTHMMLFNSRAPISKVYLQASKLIGCSDKNDNLYPFLKEDLGEPIINQKYIVVNPNASDLRLERRWDAKNYIHLIQKILDKNKDIIVALIGSKGEAPYSEKIAIEVKSERCVNYAGKTNIDGLINLIANAEMMISNDTGPMHIAFCTNTPIIALFGPCSPEQYGVSNQVYTIYKPVYCSPCVHDFETPPCKGKNVCMQIIEMNEVFHLFEEVMYQNKKPRNPVDTFIYSSKGGILGEIGR
ncbi:MAG: glycosyltransferase family 9 protein [Crocinitomicaceae bacterium]